MHQRGSERHLETKIIVCKCEAHGERLARKMLEFPIKRLYWRSLAHRKYWLFWFIPSQEEMKPKVSFWNLFLFKSRSGQWSFAKRTSAYSPGASLLQHIVCCWSQSGFDWSSSPVKGLPVHWCCPWSCVSSGADSMEKYLEASGKHLGLVLCEALLPGSKLISSVLT